MRINLQIWSFNFPGIHWQWVTEQFRLDCWAIECYVVILLTWILHVMSHMIVIYFDSMFYVHCLHHMCELFVSVRTCVYANTCTELIKHIYTSFFHRLVPCEFLQLNFCSKFERSSRRTRLDLRLHQHTILYTMTLTCCRLLKMADIRLLIRLQISAKVNARCHNPPPAPISTENGTDLQLFGRFVGNLTETANENQNRLGQFSLNSMRKICSGSSWEFKSWQAFSKGMWPFPQKNVSELCHSWSILDPMGNSYPTGELHQMYNCTSPVPFARKKYCKPGKQLHEIANAKSLNPERAVWIFKKEEAIIWMTPWDSKS